MLHDAGKKYLEYYAKELLEHLFPERYSNMQKSESPDLKVNDEYGVEITWAMFENQGQSNSVLDHVKGKNIEQIDQRYIATMRKNKAELYTNDDGTICGYVHRDCKNYVSINELLNAYYSKKKKVRNYTTTHIDLFIYPPLAQIDGWIGHSGMSDFFQCISDDSENPFEHIIVYEEPTLYLYDAIQKKTIIRRGTCEEIMQCKQSADLQSGWSKRNQDNLN